MCKQTKINFKIVLSFYFTAFLTKLSVEILENSLSHTNENFTRSLSEENVMLQNK